MATFEEEIPDVLIDHLEVDKDDPLFEELKTQYSFISHLQGKYVLYRDPEDENLVKAYFCRRWLWCYQPGCARAAKYDKNKAICVGFMNLEQAASRICEHIESSMHPVHKAQRDSKETARETVEAQLFDLMKVEHQLFTLDETEAWHQEQLAKTQASKEAQQASKEAQKAQAQGQKRPAPEPSLGPTAKRPGVPPKTQPQQPRQLQKGQDLQVQVHVPKHPAGPPLSANMALGTLGLRSEAQAMAALSSGASFQQKTQLMRQAMH